MLDALAITVITSSALTLPLTQNTSLALLTPTNITSSALEPPADLDNYARGPAWPKSPYSISLAGARYTGLHLVIARVEPFRTSPTIDKRHVQLFLRDFADILRQQYPVPDFIPREASLHSVDVTSHTKWFTWLKEGPWRGRLPTAVALFALAKLGNEVGKYEPATVGYSIEFDQSRGLWSLGELVIENLTGASLNGSLSSESDDLQTA